MKPGSNRGFLNKNDSFAFAEGSFLILLLPGKFFDALYFSKCIPMSLRFSGIWLGKYILRHARGTTASRRCRVAGRDLRLVRVGRSLVAPLQASLSIVQGVREELRRHLVERWARASVVLARALSKVCLAMGEHPPSPLAGALKCLVVGGKSQVYL